METWARVAADRKAALRCRGVIGIVDFCTVRKCRWWSLINVEYDIALYHVKGLEMIRPVLHS